MTISSGFCRTALLSLAASAVLTTGCSTYSTTAAPDLSAAGTMTGHIFGGNQPVTSSDVRLYAASNAGYGQPGTLYATTTTDVNGNFSFTQNPGVGSTQSGSKVYGCPTNGDPQMYLIARGGNTQGTNQNTNPAAAFILAIGPCSTIATAVVDLTETTTVATLAAMQQYFAPASTTQTGLNQLGYPNTTQGLLGFQKAQTLIGQMVNVQTGVVVTSTINNTPTGSTTPVSVRVTPEIAKINTLANIMAACVNTTSQTSANCTTLFQNATPPNSALTSQPTRNFVQATDTAGALYYMLVNPASGSAGNVNNLYALQAGAGAPFQPAETSSPTDWTVGVNYSSTSACSGGGSTFLQNAYHLAVDANDNVWAVAGSGGGNLFEVATNGTPMSCLLGTTLGNSNALAIGTANNVWVGGLANNNIYEIPAATPGTTTIWPTGQTNFVQAITLDGSGNLDFTPVTNGTNMYQFTGASAASAPTASKLISTALGTNPVYIAADTANRILVADTSTASNLFYDVYPSTASGNTGGYLTSNVGSASNAVYGQGVAAGQASTLLLLNGEAASAPGNSISAFTPSGPGTASGTTTASNIGGISAGREVAIDGAGSMWTASTARSAGSYVSGSTTSNLYMLNELTGSGTAISPTGTGASAATVNGGFQKDATVLPNAPRGVAIDLSGNVWTGTNTAAGTSITVLVGAAVPVVTPVAAGLNAGAASGNATQKP